MAKAAGPAGQVIAIDANAGVHARMTVNARLSGLTNIVPVHSAVGDHIGQVDLSIRRDDLSIVTVRENDRGTIPMRPLLDILGDLAVRRVDALKIDIEGYEDAALVPFFAAATEDLLPRRVSIEKGGPDGGDYPGCSAAFARLGYRLVGRTRSNSLYQRH
jgi:FkbM family methyltransferase